jgi:hypothetical protein
VFCIDMRTISLTSLIRSIGPLLIAFCSVSSAAAADSTATVYWNNATLGVLQQKHTAPKRSEAEQLVALVLAFN